MDSSVAKKKTRLEGAHTGSGWSAGKPSTPIRDALSPALETPTSVRRIKQKLFAVGTPPATPDVESPRIRRLNVTSREPMKVFLRIRPMHKEEKEKGEANCVSILSDTMISIRPPKDYQPHRGLGEVESRYTFTNVFSETAKQDEVFNSTALPLVDHFLKGSNCLIFAYGITNAGKTHTISGNKQNPGILPRVLDIIFRSMRANGSGETPRSKIGRKRKSVEMYTSSSDYSEISEPSEFEFDGSDVGEIECGNLTLQLNPKNRYAVWISYLEIYNEKIFDLLDDSAVQNVGWNATNRDVQKEDLKLKEDKAGHVFVKGQKEILVSSVEEGRAVIAKGHKNRQVANNLLNQDSSRSHSVITFKLVQIPKDKDPASIKQNPSLITYSKLSIIDLAGSERNNRTKTTGARLKEAANINTSLMTFGRCIEALKWNSQHPQHNQKMVPFRNSKLTRLFQDYFIGVGRAVMIVNISPCATDFEETGHVLKFSAIAKEVSTNLKLEELKPKGQDSNAEVPDENGGCSEDLMEMRSQLEEEKLRLIEERNQMESEIREEVSNEMAQRLLEMEQMFKKRLETEVAALEEKYQQKVNMLKALHAETKGSEAEETDLKLLHVQVCNKKEELQQLLEEVNAREEGHLKSINQLKLQLAHAEEDIAYVNTQKDVEVKYWQDKLQNHEQLEKTFQNMRQQLDAVTEENRHLTATVKELNAKIKLLQEKSQSSREPHSNEHPPLPPKTKVLVTPTKKDLMKYKKYGMMEFQSPQEHQDRPPIYYTGHVNTSVTGEGIAVTFTDIPIQADSQNESEHQQSLSTPGAMGSEINDDVAVQAISSLQSDALMHSESDMNSSFETVDLGNSNKNGLKTENGKLQKKLAKERERERKEKEKQDKKDKARKEKEEKEREKELHQTPTDGKTKNKFSWKRAKAALGSLGKQGPSSANRQEVTKMEPTTMSAEELNMVNNWLKPKHDSPRASIVSKEFFMSDEEIVRESLNKENAPRNRPSEDASSLKDSIQAFKNVVPTKINRDNRGVPSNNQCGNTPIAKRLRSTRTGPNNMF